MTTHHKQGSAAFVAVCLLSALIAWLGGYDFDYRGPPVAMWFIFTLAIALYVGVFTAFGREPEVTKMLMEELK